MGTIRRECLDHGIVFNEASLCGHLKSFLEYYHQSGTHWSLEKDTPESRSVQPPESGYVVAVPQVAGRIIGTNVEQREGEGREDYCYSTDVALCSDAQFSPSFGNAQTALPSRNLPYGDRRRLSSTLQGGPLCRSLGSRR
jgi:hypothetical protein